MGKKLITTLRLRSNSELYGYSSSKEESVIDLDNFKLGNTIFDNDLCEYVSIESITPDEVVIKSVSGKIYNVVEGKVYETPCSTRDGNHSWWYTFEIVED
ncbi:hypothetical protein [uncultured Bacteroides sp.]|uniref:hypothetical protein n=1 Tax=uncultured Bacteroides sp. TaxID=162156 RepID=UPI00261470C7|nr:hypothetical protein [uncultured Bacteroides sp.]